MGSKLLLVNNYCYSLYIFINIFNELLLTISSENLSLSPLKFVKNLTNIHDDYFFSKVETITFAFSIYCEKWALNHFYSKLILYLYPFVIILKDFLPKVSSEDLWLSPLKFGKSLININE